MSYDLIQTLIVAVIVLVAALMMGKRLFPATTRKLRTRLGLKTAAKPASGCESGCASCNGCKSLNLDLPPRP